MSSWTPSHSILMSRLLDDVVGTQEIVAMRRDDCKVYDCASSFNFDADVYFTGSKAEGLDLPGSDKDFMVDIDITHDIQVIEQGQALPHRTHMFEMVTDKDNQVFSMLRSISPHLEYKCECLFDSLQFTDSSYFLSSYLLVHNHLSRCHHEHVTVQGPSMAHEPANPYGDDYDVVNSIHCSFWPRVAAEWVGRTRLHNWPKTDVLNKIIDFGFHLVPVGYTHSPKSMMEWRISFSIAERLLVWSFNHIQIQMYAILKIILKEFIKPNCRNENYVLCSYFIKTFLFWKFEETSPHFWKIEKMRDNLLYLLLEFRTILQIGILKHYFIPNFNLLGVKLTRTAQIELLQLYDTVIQYDVKIFDKCITLKPIWEELSNIMNDTGCRKSTDLQNAYLPTRNFGQVLYKIRVDTLSLARFIYTYKGFNDHNKMLKLLGALDACTATMKTSLGTFSSRYCRLIVNIPRRTDWLKSNKYIYYITRLHDETSIDIASGKLWTAILFLIKKDYNMALHTINSLFSSIPPYALYQSVCKVVSDIEAKCLYADIFMRSERDLFKIARRAWLFDFLVFANNMSVMPAAIQMEILFSKPDQPLSISPFTLAYYLQFLCYHGLHQNGNRDRALRQLVDVTENPEQSGCPCIRYHTYNIAGHCLWFVGETARAREMFLESCAVKILCNRSNRNDNNAARHYLRSYMYNIDIELD